MINKTIPGTIYKIIKRTQDRDTILIDLVYCDLPPKIEYQFNLKNNFLICNTTKAPGKDTIAIGSYEIQTTKYYSFYLPPIFTYLFIDTKQLLQIMIFENLITMEILTDKIKTAK